MSSMSPHSGAHDNEGEDAHDEAVENEGSVWIAQDEKGATDVDDLAAEEEEVEEEREGVDLDSFVSVTDDTLVTKGEEAGQGEGQVGSDRAGGGRGVDARDAHLTSRDAEAEEAESSGDEDEDAPAATPELATLHEELSECLAQRQPSKALRVMKSLPRRGIVPDRRAFVLGLVACDRLGAWEVAVELLNDAEAIGVRPSVRMYMVALSSCASVGRWQEAIAILTRMQANRPVNAYPFSFAMTACAKAGQPKAAISLHTSMLKSGVRPTVRSYAAVLSACEKSDDPAYAVDAVLDLAEEMRDEFGLPLDSWCAMSIIRALGKRRDWKGAVDVVAAMRRQDRGQGAPAQDEAQGAEGGAEAARGFDDEGDEGLASGSRRRQSPRALNAVVYTAAMGVCANAGRLQQVDKLLGWMEADGLRPTPVTLSTLVHACAQAGEWRRALEFIEDMEAEADTATLGSSPNARKAGPTLHAYGGALRACAKARAFKDVLKLFNKMKRRGLTPNAYCYHQAILACEHAGSVRQALGMLDEMAAAGVQANIFTYTAAVQVCSTRGAFGQALRLVDDMCSRGPKPTVVTYNVLLRGAIAADQLETAAKVLEGMPKLGVDPDAYSYSMVVNGCAKAGDPEEALRWLAKMPEKMVTEMTYHGLIAALCEAGMAQRALSLLDQMRGAGLTPSPKTMRLLLEEYGSGVLVE